MKTDRTIAIITARMRSTRLKAKVLLPLYNRPALRWVADRCAQAKLVHGVVIATTADPSNDPIEKALSRDYLVYRYKGDEEDVLSRVLEVAKWINADIIVDVSGDCPLVDPRHIDFLLELLKNNSLDYASNIVKRTWPDGLDVQVYRAWALNTVNNVFNPETHAGWNIMTHPEVFRIANWPAPPEMHFPEWGLTLDTLEDYGLLHIIFNRFGSDPTFQVQKVVKWLRNNPHLLKINAKIVRKIPELEG